MARERLFDSQAQAFAQRQHAMDARGQAFTNIGNIAQGTADRYVEQQRYSQEFNYRQQRDERQFQLQELEARSAIAERNLRMQETQRRLAVLKGISVTKEAQIRAQLLEEQLKQTQAQTKQIVGEAESAAYSASPEGREDRRNTAMLAASRSMKEFFLMTGRMPDRDSPTGWSDLPEDVLLKLREEDRRMTEAKLKSTEAEAESSQARAQYWRDAGKEKERNSDLNTFIVQERVKGLVDRATKLGEAQQALIVAARTGDELALQELAVNQKMLDDINDELDQIAGGQGYSDFELMMLEKAMQHLNEGQ